MGSAAPAVIVLPGPELSAPPLVSETPLSRSASLSDSKTSAAAAPQAQTSTPAHVDVTANDAPGSEEVCSAVVTVLSDAGQRMLSAMLETGEWQIAGNELTIKVASSATVIEMSLGADAKRLMVATASGVLGRPIRLKVISGGIPQNAPRNTGSSNGGGRGRAEQDPVVHRMKEKFGAEIRTIIDYKTKR